jgi:histidine triad (HIT) family protein
VARKTTSGAECPFCAIVAGAAPTRIVWRSAATVGFLDHRPLLPGHCLLVPRAHYAVLTDLPAESRDALFADAQVLIGAIERGLAADGHFLALNGRISQSVPHLHLHLVPRRKGDGLFSPKLVWRRRPYPSDAEADATRQRIVAALEM